MKVQINCCLAGSEKQELTTRLIISLVRKKHGQIKYCVLLLQIKPKEMQNVIF